MEFDLRNIDTRVDEYAVTTAIAKVLHNFPFAVDPKERLVNFQVELYREKSIGVRNDGSGALRLPSKSLGQKFFRWYNDPSNEKIRVGDKVLRIFPTNRAVRHDIIMTLKKAPFVDPEVEKQRQLKLKELDVSLRIGKLQFGVYYKPLSSLPTDPRSFSIEWSMDLDPPSVGWLEFEYEHKLLRAKMTDPTCGGIQHSVIIKFSSIKKLAIGRDFGNQFICFDLFTPPILEQEDLYRPVSDGRERKFRNRVRHLDARHGAVADYAHHIRILLSESDDLERFGRLCRVAELRQPIHGVTIDASSIGFFNPKRIAKLTKWMKSVDWSIAFQVAALLHNGLLNTQEVESILPVVDHIVGQSQELASEVMRFFIERIPTRPLSQTPKQFLEVVRRSRSIDEVRRVTPASGRFFCYHVTITPTRLLLEGPYITQSNRVIRKYEGFEGHFLRVEFRDEDRLQFRWDREVDGQSFLEDRVGGMLKTGLDIAGRHFKFLAYSSSALRNHSVWFVNEEGFMSAESIRTALGIFTDTMYQPSKYAARIGQAFSATDPSVKISTDEWREIPDIENSQRQLFTDGVGTMSRELGRMVWEKLCEARRDRGARSVIPSAYQIRFLGFKGVVAIDEKLEGIMLCLRPSMRKFADKTKQAEIEIVRAFDKPGQPNLNRPLVMVLEDSGVNKDAFMELLKNAVADARTAHDSIDNYVNVLKANRLGFPYRLAHILLKLKTFGLDLKSSSKQESLDTVFLARVRGCVINHVLRDIKHSARIPIPQSYQLVGVADEGPAYIREGYKNVYTLPPGKIFACIQNPGEEPQWLEGQCVISRSPVVHPGDVQRVYAVGKPPANQLCLFSHLRNVVVLPSQGPRPLANCLGGGDLDGDLYEIIMSQRLLITEHADPAQYEDRKPRTLDRPSTIDDVCDFVVEYIHSDVVGLISDKHIIIADQSKDGTRDDRCLKLAGLHSQAVDYPKNGIPVDIRHLPRNLIPYKPDWHAAEVKSPRSLDYYESDRALGHMYRSVTLEEVQALPLQMPKGSKALDDPITRKLRPLINKQLQGCNQAEVTLLAIEKSFTKYKDELRYICATHTLTDAVEDRLKEEEVVASTILAKCSQPHWRKDRMWRMRECVSFLVQDTERDFILDITEASNEELCDGLQKAWATWQHSVSLRGDDGIGPFGSQSFGLVALGIILDCLEGLGEPALLQST